ncbi:MAG: hypothetical protein HY717_19625 [Planctomycetes bacterium]|nr:hypothetical protein [Planctomycetota bacterium]
MKERDRDAADDWMRDHMPDPDKYSLEDNEERRSSNEQRYFFLRYSDSATVVYRVAVKVGKVKSVKMEVYDDEYDAENPKEERWIVRPKGRGRRTKGTRGSRG